MATKEAFLVVLLVWMNLLQSSRGNPTPCENDCECHKGGEKFEDYNDCHFYFECVPVNGELAKVKKRCPEHEVFYPPSLGCRRGECQMSLIASEPDPVPKPSNLGILTVEEPEAPVAISAPEQSSAPHCPAEGEFQDPDNCFNFISCKTSLFGGGLHGTSLPCGHKKMWCRNYNKCCRAALCPTNCDGSPKKPLPAGPMGCTNIGTFSHPTDCRKFRTCALDKDDHWVETDVDCAEGSSFCKEMNHCSPNCYTPCPLLQNHPDGVLSDDVE